MGSKCISIALALAGMLALGGCSAQHSYQLEVSRNYDHLGSCFFRKIQTFGHLGSSMEPVSMYRLTSPNEMDVKKTLHFLWAPPNRLWLIRFVEAGPDQTSVYETGETLTGFYKRDVDKSISTCATDG